MQKKTVRERYLLTQDNNNNWFLIPVEHIAAWHAFCKIDDSWNMWSDEAFPPISQTPPWARPLQGSPSRVTFENPAIS